jgi:hypothetical protein
VLANLIVVSPWMVVEGLVVFPPWKALAVLQPKLARQN